MYFKRTTQAVQRCKSEQERCSCGRNRTGVRRYDVSLVTKMAYNMFDVDKAGNIEMCEAHAMIRMVHATKKPDPKIMRKLDVNGDGELSSLRRAERSSDEPRRRRGRRAEIPPTNRGDAAAAARIFSRRRVAPTRTFGRDPGARLTGTTSSRNSSRRTIPSSRRRSSCRNASGRRSSAKSTGRTRRRGARAEMLPLAPGIWPSRGRRQPSNAAKSHRKRVFVS